MQRRLIEELKDLESNIQEIKEIYSQKGTLNGDCKNCCPACNQFKKIGLILFRLITSADKSFEVVFKGKQYNFIYPTTVQEKQQMDDMAEDLIKLILLECANNMITGNDTWWMVTAFASGIDTLDMQIEIIKEEVTNRKDEEGNVITALPLDLDNYQINLQRNDEDIFKDTPMDSN